MNAYAAVVRVSDSGTGSASNSWSGLENDSKRVETQISRTSSAARSMIWNGLLEELDAEAV